MNQEAVVRKPEKIYLKCDAYSHNFPVEWNSIIDPFYQLFESQVYEWEDTHFELPESIFSRFNTETVDLGINNCFNMEECVKLSRNEDGDRIPLNKDQLNELRRYGEIRVKSLQFPGKYHIWRVNRLFQKGTENTFKDFQKDLSKVLRLIVITMKNRIVGKELSMLSSLKHIWKGLYLFLDLLFGLPHNNPGNIDIKMHDECLQFLTCEFNVSKHDTDKLSKFWDYLEKLSCLPKQCGASILKQYFPLYIGDNALPIGVYQFVTPNRLCIDLRLMNSTLGNKCFDLVQQSIEKVEQSNWFLEYKNNYIERMYHESMSIENIKKNIIADGMKSKSNQIFELLRLKCQEESIPDSICNLMIENCKFNLICSEISERLKQMWAAHKSERLEFIKMHHPYLGMISSWMRKQLYIALEEFLEKHQYTQLKMVIDKCLNEDLSQHEYFIRRYLLFQKERKQLIYHELVCNSSFPDRLYKYRSKMILPSYWKVTQSVRSSGSQCFEVDKYKNVHWSTQYPFWRWINYLLRTYMLILTIGQFLLIKLPFKTQVSYLSLFRKSSFATKFHFDSSTGRISPMHSSVVPTLFSRLTKLWNNVWKSRTKFENTPFSGMLDKSIARHFHRIWTVGLKGGMGTFGLVLIMPILCLLSSSLSIIVGIIVPIWVPFISLFIFSSSVMFYDIESANKKENRFFRLFQAILWHCLWCGVIQLTGQIVLVGIILPCIILLAMVLIFLRFGIRSCWDTLVYNLILKRYAHIPAANDFITKRVSGPGLAYEYEILVMPEHVLTGLRCLMEEYELKLWLEQVTMIIKEPLQNYRSFLDKTLHPLNITLDEHNKNIIKLYEKEANALRSVTKDYEKRIAMLNISSFTSNKEKFRMSSNNLKISLEKSEKLWEIFYTEHLYPRLNQLNYDEDVWWNKNNIRKNDMKNLSMTSLSYLFGDQILSPIEECDEVFQLETNELTLQTYVNMFITEEYQDDLDKINIISSNWNKGVSMEYCQYKLQKLQLPSLPIHSFFNDVNVSLPVLLESCPAVDIKKKSRLKWILKSVNWMKGNGKGYHDSVLDEEMSALSGSKEIKNISLYHPLVICTLLHLRDRDNAMLHLDHQAVYEGILKCMEIAYDQEFLENNLFIQSVDYSNNSLNDIFNDGDISNSLFTDDS